MAFYQWNGSSWVLAPEKKVWNGSTWVDAKGAKIWNGSAWKEYLSLDVPYLNAFYSGGGGKGVAFWSLSLFGYSSTGGIYTDDGAYYNINYSAFNIVDGDIRGFAPVEVYWSLFNSEDSSTGYYEKRLEISVTGNLSGTFTPYLDNVAIAGPKTGSFNSGKTTFRWQYGTLPNTDGSVIPGSDESTPFECPFPATNNSNIQLI